MLQLEQGAELMTMPSEELVTTESHHHNHPQTHSSDDTEEFIVPDQISSSSTVITPSQQLVSGSDANIIKSNVGQYVILPQNQFVLNQSGNIGHQSQTIRTIQLKQQPTPVPQTSVSGGMAKVIITSDSRSTGSGSNINLSNDATQHQQLTAAPTQVRVVTSNHNNSNVTGHVISTSGSPTKLTLQQIQQMGLFSPTKTITTSTTNKVVEDQHSSGNNVVRNILNSPQKIIIKSNTPNSVVSTSDQPVKVFFFFV